MWILLFFFLPFQLNSDFYDALQSESLSSIDRVLLAIEKSKSSTKKDAYKGTLLMKKSDFLKTAAQKIATFKEGAQLLENAIKKEPKNGEFRFLRLATQENAPKILKYNKNITEDKNILIEQFQSLPSELKTYIKAYAKNSATLGSTSL